MTPAEAKKFVEEASKRAEESARKWHSNPKVKASMKVHAEALKKSEK